MTENYAQPGKEDITLAVDRLQQDVRANVRSLSSAWTACFTTSPRLHSSSAAAATTRATGRRVASSRRVKRRAGWSPTAAVKPSPPCVAGGTTPPTSTGWRSVPQQQTVRPLASVLTFSWPPQGGCISKLEQFLADHLLVIGAVGIGVACLQVKHQPVSPQKQEAALAY